MRALVLVLALAGCLPKTYHCSSNSDCGNAGACEPTGFCGYADPSCASGVRYGDLSGAYTSQCVGAETDGGLADGRRPDAPAGDAPPAFCAPDPTLVGCWELEGNVQDASGNANDGTPTNVTYAAGRTGMAAVLDATSHIAIADSVSLTPTELTIEGWIYPTSLPTGSARMGIFDNDGQYGLFIYATVLQCTVSTTVTATYTPPLATWTHVACTYDGATGHLYVNGVEVANAGGGSPLGAGNTNGAALGGNSPSADTLVGRIDEVRVFNVPRTTAQICRAAGLTTCP
ncbi:MAG: LamG domain-containing protein [Acidobacteriota bacterium]